MALHEHSDVFQWGMNLFDVDPCYSPGYYGDIIQHDTGDVYHEHYFHSNYDSAESNQVENDEIIARTLQEEFSQLEIADERSSYSQADVEQFNASVPSYDWHNTPMMNYCSGGIGKCHDYVHEGVGDVETSSSSSPGEVGGCSLELVDNYPFDDEIGRRLNEITPIPHIPKINGEIPSIDEATSDHERLLDRLRLYDFVEHKVQGDGNCQLKSHPDIYEGYVPMKFSEYLENMSRSGEWGDHVTLQAAADLYGVRIFLMTSFKDTCCIEILPSFEKPKGVIFISFWAEVHYNSIYPQGDITSCESRKKKRWWSFETKHQ
ncbi:OVARIAN TUMOR DOMAIN-containing deubiquitinating enzyme 10-like isoform X9 [Trifolium pratense]|uniref:OVARIAN TUMOR DOMAIN-containing deubiquitinating enzyme 10-like isoform X9 n=1 Tax=Trifolium pratense TaxID=57577 RepID=UPI001E691412|nr:OVARIAN TUMOR DOMAIN-containing deubiquitinating enzyme 10-like isoform X9 [Trifolium pratense]